MNWIDFNLNDPIRFVLTEHGLALRAKRHNSYIGKIPGWEFKTPQYYADKQNEKGYTEMQMWCFIEEFGDEIGMCKTPVIERLNIQFKSPQPTEPCGS